MSPDEADTLRNMKYSVKHVYGTSSEEYTGTDTEPLFGTGQGSGASPAIWLGLVVILFNSLDRMSDEGEIPGLELADPWDDLHVKWRVGAFADDTNQGVLDPLGKLSIDDLVEQICRAGQLWESLLHISGGSLNLAKCSWTLQYWTWINGRPGLLPMTDLDPALLMTSGQSAKHHIITQHKNTTELKGLGVYMNFMGTFEYHAATMRTKFDCMARQLSHSSLSPILARVFYNTFYLPSVQYSLPVMSMTSIELHRVQSITTSSILNKELLYSRHYPHAVTFAPISVFGCGLLDLRVEQGLLHIQSILNYVGTNHHVGRTMLISLRHLQVEAGVLFDVLKRPNITLPHLTNCWMLSICRFCAEHAISLSFSGNRIPSVSCKGNCLLMDKALTLGMTRQELTDLNLVRIFLGATTVSDITTADGTKFHILAWKGHPIQDRGRNLTTFARQEQPTRYQRGLWRRLLRSFPHPSANSASPVLLSPLGAWTAESTMRWGAMLWDSTLYRSDPRVPRGDETNEHHHISVRFQRHPLVSKDASSPVYFDAEPDWYCSTVPKCAIPVDLTGKYIFRVQSSQRTFPSTPEPASSFPEWIQQLPSAERQLVASPSSFEECGAEMELLQYL